MVGVVRNVLGRCYTLVLERQGARSVNLDLTGSEGRLIMSFVKTHNELEAIMDLTYEYYGSERLVAYWLTKPEIVERLLPPPLEPVDEPLAYAFVADYPRTNFGPPYREGALIIAAQYDGVRGGYCLAVPVHDDMAMAGGREMFGYPKKIADISFAKEDVHVSGYLRRHGQPFFTVEAILEQPPNDANFLAISSKLRTVDNEGVFNLTMYNFKHFTAPGGRGFDYKPRLVRQTMVMQPRETRIGRMEVSLPPSDCDPWYEVEVVQPLGAMYIVGNSELLPGEVVAEVEGAAFAPYSFLKWDI